MDNRGRITCWSCRGPTPASLATCVHCGHPLAAAPPVPPQGYGRPPTAVPSGYPFPFTPGSPSMAANAAIGSRLFAIFIDFFIVAFLYFPVLVIMPTLLGTNLYQWMGLLGSVLNILLPLALFWFYKAGLEMMWGASIGKKVLGLRVVNRELGEITPFQALLRNADIMLWGFTLAIIPLVSWMFIKSRGQSVGDLFAQTFVVPK